MTTNYAEIPEVERRADLKEATDAGIEAPKQFLPEDARATLLVAVDDMQGGSTQTEISATCSARNSQTDMLFVLNATLGTEQLIRGALNLARYCWRGPGQERYSAAVAAVAGAYERQSVPPSDSPGDTPASSAASHASPAASESPPDGADAAPAPASRESGATA